MTTYTARAVRWHEGWELHVDGVGVTQVRTLDKAVQQVRDFIETDLEIDASNANIDVIPDLGSLTNQVRRAREHTRQAEEAQRTAAREAREVARKLRRDGLSVSDTATILGVSRGRVSQLVRG